MKYSSYQSRVCKRVVELLMEYEDNDGVKIFEQFKSHIYYNLKQSLPNSRYPAMFIFIDGVSREPFGIKRQDWWVMNIKVIIYTLDKSENDMNFHYKCVEGLDRVCRVNPRLHLDGQEDLSIHKADLEDAVYDFAYGDTFLVSESSSTIGARTKLCLANQMS